MTREQAEACHKRGQELFAKELRHLINRAFNSGIWPTDIVVAINRVVREFRDDWPPDFGESGRWERVSLAHVVGHDRVIAHVGHADPSDSQSPMLGDVERQNEAEARAAGFPNLISMQHESAGQFPRLVFSQPKPSRVERCPCGMRVVAVTTADPDEMPF